MINAISATIGSAMADSFIPEVVVSNRLEKAKAEIFSYIESNAEAIDENLPIFFENAVTILDRVQASPHP